MLVGTRLYPFDREIEASEINSENDRSLRDGRYSHGKSHPGVTRGSTYHGLTRRRCGTVAPILLRVNISEDTDYSGVCDEPNEGSEVLKLSPIHQSVSYGKRDAKGHSN